ncbi:MAG: pyruvate kinase [Spirochaetia bacterium]|nr:pyruvate kinase [Spirochaetia bacterium]
MRKTKIIATLGPASSEYGQILSLISAGVNVFRLNFSHGDYASFKKLIDNIKKARTKSGRAVAILQDLQGPKIRVCNFEGTVNVKRGDILKVKSHDSNVQSEDKEIAIDFPGLYKYVKPGQKILINDGLVQLRVNRVKGTDILCAVTAGGEITRRKGVNLPGVVLPVSAMTKKDRENLKFGLSQGVDIVSLSFVRSAQDIIELKKAIKGRHRPLIIAKMEKPEALKYTSKILDECDGIMVARGDMAVEAGYRRIPEIQKKLITAANEKGKICIVATQMLESMIENPYPGRAEITDIYNAVLDGADVLMLSGETSVGKYPAKTVRVMADIIRKAETDISRHEKEPCRISTGMDHENAVSLAAASIPAILPGSILAVKTDAVCDIAFMSDYRPANGIMAMTEDKTIYNKLAIYNSVEAVYMKKVTEESVVKYLSSGNVNLKTVVFADLHPCRGVTGRITILRARA